MTGIISFGGKVHGGIFVLLKLVAIWKSLPGRLVEMGTVLSLLSNILLTFPCNRKDPVL